MQAWPGSLALLALSVVTTLFAGAAYLERVHGWDRVTARCASMPGAFASVVVLAATGAADLPRVVLAQSIRIFTLVALMPAMLTFAGGGSSGTFTVDAVAWATARPRGSSMSVSTVVKLDPAWSSRPRAITEPSSIVNERR